MKPRSNLVDSLHFGNCIGSDEVSYGVDYLVHLLKPHQHQHFEDLIRRGCALLKGCGNQARGSLEGIPETWHAMA